MTFIIYVAAAIAVGLLMGFTVLSVLWMRNRLKANIRDHTVGLISVYDELLEEKSQKLAELNQDIADSEKAFKLAEKNKAPKENGKSMEPNSDSGIMLSAAERAAVASYRDTAAGELYQMIRTNFGFAPDELLPGLKQNRPEDCAERRLLEQLDFDTAYQLSTLQGEQQIAVLQESLPEEGKSLLADYIKTVREFDILAFYDSLRFAAEELSGRARLYVPPALACASAGTLADVIADSEICEGFRAELDGKVYDYCMTKREMR